MSSDPASSGFKVLTSSYPTLSGFNVLTSRASATSGFKELMSSEPDLVWLHFVQQPSHFGLQGVDVQQPLVSGVDVQRW
eukprot:12906717-Prorocentrum_lima.AAC.1